MKQEYYIIIPGNPGIISCYKPMKDLLSGIVEIQGHKGHNNEYKNYDCGLKSQLEHHLKETKKYYQKYKKPFSIIAHSFGGYITLYLLKKLPSRWIKKVYLIAPTIDNFNKCNQIYLDDLNKKINNKNKIILFSKYFNKSPRIVKEFITKYSTDFINKEMIKDISCFLSNPIYISNVLSLAEEELDNISNVDTKLLSKNKHKIEIIYFENDKTVPVSAIRKVKSIIKNTKILKNINHQFMINDNQQNNYNSTKRLLFDFRLITK